MSECTIGVVGAGSWGTALAAMVAEKGLPVTLWAYEKELVESISAKHRNPLFLPEAELPATLICTGDMRQAVAAKRIVLWVTPVKAFRALFAQGLSESAPGAIHVCASKGIENDTLETVSQMAADIARGRELAFAVLSGPSFAHDVARRMPTAVVIASQDQASAAAVQETLATPYFRTYTSQDVVGVEIGGALKNVIAVASGIVEGLGLGHNTRAALITRGLAEIMRLGIFLGADPLTFSGLSGIGDLVLTCTSTQSRNYSVGLQLGQGKKLDEVLSHMNMVAEGVYTTRSAYALSRRHGIDMPIVTEIYQILFEGKSPQQAVKALMGRDLKKEILL
ncbi:MAG: NAD(P)-dependent glycerol-3-phosphate dehydrogenase [Deltaproteobacteria bacterium]|nr:NAD(P)-dependent glycerol-3-phosphate dehydrogenase [Deltaproteobacteria bacterium]